MSASAAITERLDAKAREAKLLREVFKTFAKTVDTFVASYFRKARKARNPTLLRVESV
ncbi:hypothetical protein PDIDSM_6198 [Penicillium digitatum]|nr:hypothetical protein PDIDSM_6198 [Penicillium digitatum]